MAQEQAEPRDEFYDFMYPKYLLKRMYGINMQELDYLDDAFDAWKRIGNVAVALHGFEGTVDENGEVELPCNLGYIEAVTTVNTYRDLDGDLIIWYDNSNIVTNPDSFLPDVKLKRYNYLSNAHTELHPQGGFVTYELIGRNSIRVDRSLAGSPIVVMYRGIIMDDEGNPCVTRKESEAIVHRLAYIETQLGAYEGDQIKASMLSEVKYESGRAMQAAKIPEYLSQNFMNQLLSAKTRHDRKVFNSDYKLLH